MFEIRIICDAHDTDRVTTTLAETFTTGAVRRSPSRTSDKERLYITAEHRDDTDEWPTPERAYAKAPSIISEIGWTAQRAHQAVWPLHQSDVREFWLRKAALLDRLALGDAKGLSASDATELAKEAAGELVILDNADPAREPRAYIRQQYRLWMSQR